jgi:membrane protease YdiL (CAAX protease family)
VITNQNLFKSAYLSYFKVFLFIWAFYLLNFDFQLAVAYSIILVVSYVWFDKDPFISFPIERQKSNRTSAIIESLVGYGALFVSSNFLLSNYSSGQSFLTLFAEFTPVLAGNVILTLIGWGFLIAVAETMLFNGILFEGMAEFANKRGFKGNLKSINPFSLSISALVSAFFALFHFSVRFAQLRGDPAAMQMALLITFIFSFISCILVIRNQEMKQALLLHIMNNTAVTLAAVGLVAVTL